MPPFLRSGRHGLVHQTRAHEASQEESLKEVDDPESILRKARRKTRETYRELLVELLNDPDIVWKKPRSKGLKAQRKTTQTYRPKSGVLQVPTSERQPNLVGVHHLSKGRSNSSRDRTRVSPSCHDQNLGAAGPQIQSSTHTGVPQGSEKEYQSTQTVSTWVEQLPPPSTVPFQQPEKNQIIVSPSSSADVETLGDSMAFSATYSNAFIFDDGSGKTPVTYRDPLLPQKLRRRGIDESPTKDKRLPDIQALIVKSPPIATSEVMSEVKLAVTTFLRTLEGDTTNEIDMATEEDEQADFFSRLNSLCLGLDGAKAKLGYPVILNDYFQSMLEKCSGHNEAVLQRSIMMNIFHQHWIRERFDWNAEHQWIIGKGKHLKTHSLFRPDKEMEPFEKPKPDLVIAFTSKLFERSVLAWDPPGDLVNCINPDGRTRCFPFLLMEVKKREDSLEEAESKNLRTAGQALYNIYHWMDRAEMRDAFFAKIRVFSLVFNAQRLSVRVHRSEPASRRDLSFKFTTLWPQQTYTKDSICMLVNSILREYAAKELLDTLKEAVQILHKHQEIDLDDGNPRPDFLSADKPQDENDSEDSDSTPRPPDDRLRNELLNEGHSQNANEPEDRNVTALPSNKAAGKRPSKAGGERARKTSKGNSGNATKPSSSKPTRTSQRRNGKEPQHTGQSFEVSELSI